MKKEKDIVERIRLKQKALNEINENPQNTNTMKYVLEGELNVLYWILYG